LLGFVICSFGAQNLFLCFWGLDKFVFRFAVQDFEELLQKTSTREDVWTGT
jgi:hypothetical protein